MAASRLPWVVPHWCEQCTVCVTACPKGLLAMRLIGEYTEVPWLDAPDACTGCGRCADVCPMGGIVMTEYVEDARVRFLERYTVSA